MEAVPEHIHPIFDRMLGRQRKEALLQQRGLVVWLYGLSGSGKSTLAMALEHRLHAEGFLTQILDGDNIRGGLNKNLGFSEEDRRENIRRIAEVAKLYVGTGIVTIASFITPWRSLRSMARAIVGPRNFFEVFVDCSLATCESRDVKGLYAKAQAGQLRQFTGKDSTFEPPEPLGAANLILNTDTLPVEAALRQLYDAVLPRIRFNPAAAGSS